MLHDVTIDVATDYANNPNRLPGGARLSCEKICYFDLIKCAHDSPPLHAVWENTQYIYYTMKSGACQFLTPELTQYINISIKI